MRDVPPPSRVICSPTPSMVVVVVSVLADVMGIVTGPPPQLKVTLPPPVRAVLRAASVQLPAEPVPTTPAAPTNPADASQAETASSQRAPIRSETLTDATPHKRKPPRRP